MSRIALVHDYFVQMGGAERVAEALHDSFPTSPMYTTVALRHRLPHGLRAADVRTSVLQHLPAMERRFRHYFMFYPWAVESLDLSEYDLIVSSSSGYAKGVHRRRNAIHICYCHTPMRWVWRYEDYAAREGFSRASRALLPLLLSGLKRLDSIGGPLTCFMGRQPDGVAARYASRCRALLFPGEEDFGMSPLEVNAAGRPVIAYNAGGAIETVVEGVTGLFFNEPTSASLASAMEEFETCSWNRRVIRQDAEKIG